VDEGALVLEDGGWMKVRRRCGWRRRRRDEVEECLTRAREGTCEGDGRKKA
jgi:hypothetical protein